MGERVTLVLGNGSRHRVKLPFAPAHPLPQLPMDALRSVLKPEAWRALFSAQLMHPGDTPRHAYGEHQAHPMIWMA